MEKRVIIIIMLLAIGIYLNILSSNYIAKNYPNAPIAIDIILNNIEKEHTYAMKISEILILVSGVIFIFYLNKNRQLIYPALLTGSLFLILRGLLLPLTILSPVYSSSFLKGYETFNYGLFPSGHIAIPFLFFLFTYKKSKLWILFLIVTVIVGWLLLIGKQHYTIDIISSIIFLYAIKSFSEKIIL